MSASDKKKLRKEQSAAVLSEKQRQEQAEAKKLKLYTIGFVTVIALVFCIAVAVLGIRAVNQSGIFMKSTIAATIDGQQLNTVEMNYYYNDAINQFYSEWYEQYETYTDSYLQVVGLDVTKPLNEQMQDEETGTTWADYFVNTALENAKSDYTVYKAAMADPDFALPEEDKTTMENMLSSLSTYAQLYGFSNSNKYLQSMYGYGSDEESYRAYVERNTIATAYLNYQMNSLEYDNEDLRKYEEGKVANYNSYTYSYAYLSYTDFRQGGTENENGTVEYSDEENEAARLAAKVAADQLAACTTLDEIKEMIETIQVSESSELVVNDYTNEMHTNLNAVLADWLNAEERKEGDIAALANTSTTKDDDGNEVTTTNGYYVIYFKSKSDNTKPMSNVRHLLVQFEGGTKDEESGETIYSETEKAAAKEEAEGYLKTWNEGAKTEDSFIALVKEHSDDSSAEDGGLFENIHPHSEYVENFLNWSIDPTRQAGDTGVIETEYGYHVMYYVGDAEMSYRDYLIENELRYEDHEAWYEALLEPVKAAAADTSKMKLDMILSVG